MTTENFKNWLKSQIDVGDGIAVGAIDGNKSRFIGVYDSRGGSGSQRLAIGGKDCTVIGEKRIRILVHWTNSPVQAESKAMEIYNLLEGLSGVSMDGIKVYAVDPGNTPIPLGRDERGICEYVIEATLIHERS